MFKKKFEKLKKEIIDEISKGLTIRDQLIKSKFYGNITNKELQKDLLEEKIVYEKDNTTVVTSYLDLCKDVVSEYDFNFIDEIIECYYSYEVKQEILDKYEQENKTTKKVK